ncbi:MAG: sulfate ABC transporter permease subunit CysT [Intestinibacter sp.]
MKKAKNIIPGFGISFGFTITFFSLVVLIPMLSIIIQASNIGFNEFIEIITNKRILMGFEVSLVSSLIAALINSFFGLVLAWVLVRYEFPFKRLVDGIIELPFALPTAVAGIALTTLFSETGWIGRIFYKFGIETAYSRIGIVIALVFIGIPFVVRTIQPVLEKLDGQYEEAANILGASNTTTFFKVIFPEILPALLTGFGLAFARGVGEYGSVVFISGNMPMKTEIVPLLIMSKLEQYNYTGATAIALVMLVISFLILLIINSVQIYYNKFTKE